MESEINVTKENFEQLKKVTPLSKYLAMTLFIALPFIGGWIGYQYAPEKVVGVDRVVYETKTLDENVLDGKQVFVTNIEDTSSGDSERRLLLGDGGSKTIYKYNPKTLAYEVLVEDVRNLRHFDEMNVRSLMGLRICGWSDDLRYLGIMLTMFEGVSDLPIYYIDTQDIESGFHVVSNFITNTDKDVISPDGTKVLGFEATVVSENTFKDSKGPDGKYKVYEINKKQVNFFDLNDLGKLGSTSIYTLPDENLTFLEPDFYTGANLINGKWIDNNTVELKVSKAEDYHMLASQPSEDNYAKFEEALETVVVKIE